MLKLVDVVCLTVFISTIFDVIPVRFAPLIAGNAPVSFDAVSVDILASATVPVNCPAGILVKFAPLPLNEVEVVHQLRPNH